MSKEIYERLSMDVTEFDIEDVITTSGEGQESQQSDHTYEVISDGF